MTFVTVSVGGIAIQRTTWAIWFWVSVLYPLGDSSRNEIVTNSFIQQLGRCAVAGIFVYFMCPETGAKSLEEVDLAFVNNEDAPAVMNDLEDQGNDSNEKDSNQSELKEKR